MTWARRLAAWIITGVWFFGLPFFAAASTCYLASGFGGSNGSLTHTGSEFNGTYEDSGSTFNSNPIYQNRSNNLLQLVANNSTPTRLDLGYDNGGGIDSAVAFYNPTVTGFDPTTGSWLINPAGLIAGSFTVTSCGGGSGTTTFDNFGSFTLPPAANIISGVTDYAHPAFSSSFYFILVEAGIAIAALVLVLVVQLLIKGTKAVSRTTRRY